MFTTTPSPYTPTQYTPNQYFPTQYPSNQYWTNGYSPFQSPSPFAYWQNSFAPSAQFPSWNSGFNYANSFPTNYYPANFFANGYSPTVTPFNNFPYGNTPINFTGSNYPVNGWNWFSNFFGNFNPGAWSNSTPYASTGGYPVSTFGFNPFTFSTPSITPQGWGTTGFQNSFNPFTAINAYGQFPIAPYPFTTPSFNGVNPFAFGTPITPWNFPSNWTPTSSGNFTTNTNTSNQNQTSQSTMNIPVVNTPFGVYPVTNYPFPVEQTNTTTTSRNGNRQVA